MNTTEKWILDGLRLIMKQLRHIEHKQDILLEHLGAQLPQELVQAGAELATKTEALRVALEQVQAQPQTQKET